MIRENILRVRERIRSTLSKYNRAPDSVTIVAVSKGRAIEQINEVVESDITDIGENRVQEALAKYKQLTTIKWHMVGHLQTNKVKDALRIFDLIQSADSLHLAKEIDRQASKINKIQDILIEVNTSGEATKFGFRPKESIEAIREVIRFKNINIKGLMTIAPIVDNPENSRPYFRMLRELKDKINTLHITPYTLHILSMGMTEDFEVAIQEGSNMIRLGRAIFEG